MKTISFLDFNKLLQSADKIMIDDDIYMHYKKDNHIKLIEDSSYPSDPKQIIFNNTIKVEINDEGNILVNEEGKETVIEVYMRTVLK